MAWDLTGSSALLLMDPVLLWPLLFLNALQASLGALYCTVCLVLGADPENLTLAVDPKLTVPGVISW